MKDRVPKYPGRVKITRSDGTSEYVTIERADEPVSGNEGTPLNKATLLSDDTAAQLKLTSDDPTVDDALKKLKTDADTPAFCYLFDVKKAYISTAITKQGFNASLVKPADKVTEAQGDIFLSPDMKHTLEIKLNSTDRRTSLGSYRIGTIDLESGDITFDATQSLPGAYYTVSSIIEIVPDIDNDGAILTFGTDRNEYSLYFLQFKTGTLKLISTDTTSWSNSISHAQFEIIGDNSYYASRHHEQYIVVGLTYDGSTQKATIRVYDKISAKITSIPDGVYHGFYIKCTDKIIYADTTQALYYWKNNGLSYINAAPSGAAIQGLIRDSGTTYSPSNCGPESTFARGGFLHVAYRSDAQSSSGNFIYYEHTYDISGTGKPVLLSQASREGAWPNAFDKDANGVAKKAIRLYDPINKKIVSGVSKQTTTDRNGNINPNVQAVSPDCIRTRTLLFDADVSDETVLYAPRTVAVHHLSGVTSYAFAGHKFIKVPWLKNVVLTDFGLLWIDMDNLKAV